MEYLPEGSNGAHLLESRSTEDLMTHNGVHYWDGDYNDIIVVPSLTLDSSELEKVKGSIYYEERQLYNLVLLRKPMVRLIYMTSIPLDPSVVEYYWSLLPGNVPFSEVSSRLMFVSVHDDSPKSLTQKILDKPKLVQRLKKVLRKYPKITIFFLIFYQIIRNPSTACMTCFNSTELEKQLADMLDITLIGTDPETSQYGTKIGSHQIFEESGVPHPQVNFYF